MERTNCDIFQFPVGMSNRSYLPFFIFLNPQGCWTFNSPWECRIGLTYGRDNNTVILEYNFQFPVGMSNRSYQQRPINSEVMPWGIFQFPVGMSNRSYLQKNPVTYEGYTFDFQFPVGMSNRSYCLIIFIPF